MLDKLLRSNSGYLLGVLSKLCINISWLSGYMSNFYIKGRVSDIGLLIYGPRLATAQKSRDSYTVVGWKKKNSHAATQTLDW